MPCFRGGAAIRQYNPLGDLRPIPQGVAASVTTVSRDVGSTVGGVLVQIRGTGFQNISSGDVLIGGINPSIVYGFTSTTVDCLFPSHSAGLVDVTVAGVGSGNNLFEYLPAPTTTYVANTTMEDSTRGTWTLAQTNPTYFFDADDTSRAYAGTHCRKMTRLTGWGVGNGSGQGAGGSRLSFDLGGNKPLSETNGIYARCYFYVTTAQLALLQPSQAQIKFCLQRKPSGGSGSGYTVIGLGSAYPTGGANDLKGNIDQTGANVAGSGVDVRDRWTEFAIWITRKSGLGYCRTWVDGKNWLNLSSASMGDDSAGSVAIEFGLAWTEQAIGIDATYEMQLDNTGVWNGWVDP